MGQILKGGAFTVSDPASELEVESTNQGMTSGSCSTERENGQRGKAQHSVR